MHTVIVAHGDTENIVSVECAGEDCALCDSTVEDRARITFVKSEDWN